jgi:hypothetical protein
VRSLIEWLVALGVLAGAIWLVAPVALRWLPVGDTPITLVESATPRLPRGIPDSADSVPFVMLPDGAVVRVGADEKSIRRILPERWRSGDQVTEEGVFGDRHIMGYRIDQSRVWVVLERTSPNTERRITAIYVE